MTKLPWRIIRAIIQTILAVVVLAIAIKISTSSQDRDEGVFKIKVGVSSPKLLGRGISNPLGGIETKAAKVAATAVQSAAAVLSTAVEKISITSSLGSTRACGGFGDSPSCTSSNLLLKLLWLCVASLLVSSAAFVLSYRRALFRFPGLFFSIFAWVCALVSFLITGEIRHLAREVSSDHLQHGFVYTASWVNLGLTIGHVFIAGISLCLGTRERGN